MDDLVPDAKLPLHLQDANIFLNNGSCPSQSIFWGLFSLAGNL